MTAMTAIIFGAGALLCFIGNGLMIAGNILPLWLETAGTPEGDVYIHYGLWHYSYSCKKCEATTQSAIEVICAHHSSACSMVKSDKYRQCWCDLPTRDTLVADNADNCKAERAKGRKVPTDEEVADYIHQSALTSRGFVVCSCVTGFIFMIFMYMGMCMERTAIGGFGTCCACLTITLGVIGIVLSCGHFLWSYVHECWDTEHTMKERDMEWGASFYFFLFGIICNFLGSVLGCAATGIIHSNINKARGPNARYQKV